MALQIMVSLVACIVITTVSASAVVRFQGRSLMVSSSLPGAVATYTISMEYATTTSIGSLDLLFCINPIPTEPCDPPAGLDVSNAVLESQEGEAGYTISQRSANHLVLTRIPTIVAPNVQSKYVLSGIVNPTYKVHSHSIRMADHASTDATGPVVDLGSVVTQITDSIEIQTQVPPILIFCLSKQVSADCSTVEGGNYTDFGETLGPNDTLTTESQMAVGTNASSGYAVTVNGTSLTSGTKVIDPLPIPTSSVRGINQFGINLVANSDPSVGKDPDGDSANAIVSPEYSQPNMYMFRDGDVVASAPNVSLVRRFTMSYIVNANKDLRAGTYTTTITFICSGRF